MKYFIGNWKMFGIPTSIKIIDRINNFVRNDKKNSKKYKVMISPPHTLLESLSKNFKNKKVSICAQNCFHKNNITFFLLLKIFTFICVFFWGFDFKNISLLFLTKLS